MRHQDRLSVKIRTCNSTQEDEAIADLAPAMHKAIVAAGLSPATLAADPDCIKRLVESASAYLRLPIGSYASGDSLKAMVAALAAIGKEPA